MPSEPILVNADLTRLAQVFLNLLNNAAKYTDRGGKIVLTVARQGTGVSVSVRDTGIGIPPEHLTRIFHMFSQVDRSLEKSRGGLGIGLTLVRRLVEKHGGTVEARSDGPGKGSEFIVHLPQAAAPGMSAGPIPMEGEVSARPLRILVVDDNHDGANSLAMLLLDLGHETRTAYDGVEGLREAEAFHPEVILLDIGLPVLNGYEVCRKIREQDWGRRITIVALTGWGQDEDRRRSQSAGFDHHMVKPVDPQLLMKVLAQVAKATDQA